MNDQKFYDWFPKAMCTFLKLKNRVPKQQKRGELKTKQLKTCLWNSFVGLLEKLFIVSLPSRAISRTWRAGSGPLAASWIPLLNAIVALQKRKIRLDLGGLPEAVIIDAERESTARRMVNEDCPWVQNEILPYFGPEVHCFSSQERLKSELKARSLALLRS